jgi:hypothetical protein
MKHHNDDLLLHYFNPGEFGPNQHGRTIDWWPDMDPAFLVRLDVFRRFWGEPITVSGHRVALGRHNGPDNTSDHNIDVRGTVQCADVFPSGLTSQADAGRARDLARAVGLSSIGLYPHWSRPGLHLGVRKDHGGNKPMAAWGAVNRNGKQVYVSWDEALRELPEA